ncbi:hypothetical protein Pint_29107 [Pistacia integerrima]|uniref:Uncharacterized protein n=1 Tax=Pistacia integerrima TaxID=434235 RepID=A0ACC0WXK8_9ROSI|nr:hypothetical protein Pint_29107 [Pistacia integerrima]
MSQEEREERLRELLAPEHKYSIQQLLITLIIKLDIQSNNY